MKTCIDQEKRPKKYKQSNLAYINILLGDIKLRKKINILDEGITEEDFKNLSLEKKYIN